MASHDQQNIELADVTGVLSRGRPIGLLEKLVAAVRPQFRVDVLVIDPTDPVYGGPACLVQECPRAARLHGLCEGHGQRWKRHGRPDLGEFAASTSAAMRSNLPLQPCTVSGCRNGRNSTGLCVGHLRAWQRAGSPPVEAWSATVAPVTNPAPHGGCRVPSCTLWATANTPLCTSHAAQWRVRGRPDVDDFAAAYEDKPLPAERIDLLLLEPDLRLEMQYVLQQRRDEQQVRIQPALVQHALHVLARSGMHSLLEWPDDLWRERIHTDRGTDAARPFLTYARRQLEHLCYGSGWDIEYPRDTWRLRNLAISGQPANLRFDRIPQPWLKDLAKRWIRWRLASGLSANHASRAVTAVTRFAQFLAQPHRGVQRLEQVDRSVLESYLAELRTQADTKGDNHRRLVGLLGAFFHDIRRHRWDPSLPTDAVFFTEDLPKKRKRLPRALAEHVMAQVEHPDNLARWGNPAYRLITLILIRCGLRITDAVRLTRDCIVHDGNGAPYLRYVNHKMKREALVPIDEELEAEIVAQQLRPRSRWADGTPVLFPRPLANLTGAKPLGGGTYRQVLYQWLQLCDIRDEHGDPVHLTPHQWRHTLGTRLINRDVPQEVIRKILDHDSPEMTGHYARLSDTTIRRHWEQARKVNANGENVTIDPDGPLAEASWAKQRLSRATQALPNGYCGLPLVQTCPHANSCLTCPMFITTPDFLPQHHQHHQQTLQIISAAQARGQTRLVEMNRQVADNLEKIITALEDEDPEQQDGTANAS